MSNSKIIILLAIAVALAAFAALGVGRFELGYAQILAHFKTGRQIGRASCRERV